MSPATVVAATPPTSDGSQKVAPGAFYRLAGRSIPWCFGLAALAGAAGLLLGLAVAPADGEQRGLARIVFIHAPVAWMSLLVYVAMAVSAARGLLGGTRLPMMLADALAPSGALAAFLALWSGSLWGKPGSGSWWTWDARLTSVLLLLALFLGFIALRATLADRRQAQRAGAWLALAGVVLVPAVHFALSSANDPHVGAAPALPMASPVTATGLAALVLMVTALAAWVSGVVLYRMRSAILETGLGSDWLPQLPEARR